MIIPSPFIKLDYIPKDDILYLEWPSITDYTAPELNHILDSIVDTVRHYDIRKALIDSRKAVISISPEDYAAVLARLASGLMATRLQKLARLTTGNSEREDQVKDAAALAKDTFVVRSFGNTADAMEWLKS